ncbi:hypothetical protein FJ651_09320 [Paucihalobacter ruber]|uniref:Signal transduction histidine kinase internal region domain-containing protein n=1 Tax=Paucihalobacter ruber TaxID=2567861 RepID=A0A506PI88_9FLAO|nr:histidine kinase [Paucihalobacter ruber]TPV33284.1 hypothetical protein FJ651_09320 [Paucihalobacter ruber]
MKTNKLIFLISLGVSVFFNIPRLNFLYGNRDPFLSNLIEVSIEDTIFRVFSLFCFSVVILKFNLSWNEKINFKYHKWVSSLINLSFFFFWMLFLKLVNLWVYDFDTFSMSTQIINISYLLVMLILIVVSRIIRLTEQSKQNAIEKERLVQQNLQNELSALRNQINPHFLFNSLNSLSLLVMEDQKAARTFINKLSFMFRYMLQSKDQDMVTIKEEVKFLDSYIHLIKQRYRDNFHALIEIKEKLFQHKIPTLALQILMENAVKHNEISNENPLHVEVFDHENYIVVKNKIQVRTGTVESTNTGLSNLNSRFKLLMNKEIEISADDKYFKVKIPIS